MKLFLASVDADLQCVLRYGALLTKGHVHTNKEDDAATESCESSDESASSNHDYTPQFRGTCLRNASA
jgi:hypothetical protein